MKLQEQFSYRTHQSWRPQPTLLTEDSLQFTGVSFSWGEMDVSQKAFENIRIFVEATLNQSEVTNPFGFNESLSSLENALYSGCSQANDVIYRLINNITLTSGLEGLWMIKKGKELAMIQVGQPQVYLIRNQTLTPLFGVGDITTSQPNNGEFLPHRLLGVHNQGAFNIQSVGLEDNDQLLLLAHSLIPMSLHDVLKSKSKIYDAKLLFQKIAKEHPHCPFWISTFL